MQWSMRGDVISRRYTNYAVAVCRWESFKGQLFYRPWACRMPSGPRDRSLRILMAVCHGVHHSRLCPTDRIVFRRAVAAGQCFVVR